MSFQTQNRQELPIFAAKEDIIKFHPFLNLDVGHFLFEIGRLQFAPYPLKAKGYGSIGYTRCKAKGKGREGRWKNSDKAEGGLHQETLKTN